jgi:3-oxoadipate enol-lactonase
MPIVRANGIGIYCEDSGGDGEPVVLIHGHSVDMRMWPAQTLALREAGYRVVRYDVRGHGRSDAPDEGYSWPVYAEDLRCLLDALDIGTAHLVGFSMGGGIALQFALDHPGRTRSLTLIDAAVPGFAYSDAFAATIEALVEAVRAVGWRAAAEQLWLTHPMFDGLRRHPAAFDVVRDIVLDFRARDYLVEASEPEEPEAIARIEELRPPALVLVGEEDLEDFRLAADVVTANAPRARLEVVRGAGHMLPLERPGEVNRRLLAFLANTDSVAARPPPVLAVRPATPDDVDAIASIDSSFSTRRRMRLERRGLAPALTFDFTMHEGDEETARDNAQPVDYWREHLRDGDTVLAATLDGAVVGAAVLQEWDFNRSLWVADIRVQPAARRRGAGRALIDAAASRARDRGLVSLRLETQSDNVDAVQFYLKYGFRFSGFDDRLYLHLYQDPERENRIALFFTYQL